MTDRLKVAWYIGEAQMNINRARFLNEDALLEPILTSLKVDLDYAAGKSRQIRREPQTVLSPGG